MKNGLLTYSLAKSLLEIAPTGKTEITLEELNDIKSVHGNRSKMRMDRVQMLIYIQNR